MNLQEYEKMTSEYKKAYPAYVVFADGNLTISPADSNLPSGKIMAKVFRATEWPSFKSLYFRIKKFAGGYV